MKNFYFNTSVVRINILTRTYWFFSDLVIDLQSKYFWGGEDPNLSEIGDFEISSKISQ